MTLELQCTDLGVPSSRPKSLLFSKPTLSLPNWPSVLSEGSVCIPAHYSPEPSVVGYEWLKSFGEATGLLGDGNAEQALSCSPQSTAVELCCTAHKTPAMKRLVKSVIQGLKAFQEPERALNGMGGTYFFRNEDGKKVAILKPCDEEPLAPNNPNGFVGRSLGDAGWKPTVRVGEAALREVAAYLLDHDHFANVPCTVLVRARHTIFHQATRDSMTSDSPCTNDTPFSLPSSDQESPLSGAVMDSSEQQASSRASLKLGSLQEFVTHDFDTSEMGASRFGVRDVQRIGILDIRLFNTDRHAGNILVRKVVPGPGNFLKLHQPEYELMPIDHGFCLPEALDAPYFEWLHWPQARQPFGPEELRYIERLDAASDIALLQSELPGLRPACFRVLQVTTTLLKKCAAAGLCLMEIASLMSRPSLDCDDDPSQLEQLCMLAREAVDSMELDDSEADSWADETDYVMLEDGSIGMSTMVSVQEDMELLFDMEDENGRARSRRSLDLNCSPLPPSPLSIASSSTPESLSPASHMPAGCPSPLGRPCSLFNSSGIQALGRSLHDQKMWSRFHKSRDLSSPRPVVRTHTGVLVIKYPPAVAGSAPQSVKDIFSNLSESQWKRFIDVLNDEIDACLERGDWRCARPDDRGVAQSCPKF